MARRLKKSVARRAHGPWGRRIFRGAESWGGYVLSILLEESSEKLRRIILLHFGTSVSLWEKSQTPHVHDFGISGRVHDSPNHFFYFWRHQDTLKQQENH